MRNFFYGSEQWLYDIIYFHQQYPFSLQGKIQQTNSSDKKEIYEQAIYCFLTPATKSNAADHTIQELLIEDFFYHASLEELAACLRKPPYIRFHNQKAQRLKLWQEQGDIHIEQILSLCSAFEKRDYLVKNVKGMNYKESTHFLRNIGQSDDLVILDRHIINFMKKVNLLTDSDDMSTLSRKYLIWEKLFIDFINSDLWIDCVGQSTIPRADFALWASGVKAADTDITYERIMELR